MSVEVFGHIRSASACEEAVIDTLSTWCRTYLAEAERQLELPARTLDPIADYKTVNEWEGWPDDRLPCAIVISPGITGRPRISQSKISITQIIGIGVVVGSNNQADTNRLAKVYEAVVRTILLQHQDLGDGEKYGGVDWQTSRYNMMPPVEGRTLAAGQAVFEVDCRDVVTENIGPIVVPADPYDPDPTLPTVQTQELTVAAVSEIEEE